MSACLDNCQNSSLPNLYLLCRADRKVQGAAKDAAADGQADKHPGACAAHQQNHQQQQQQQQQQPSGGLLFALVGSDKPQPGRRCLTSNDNGGHEEEPSLQEFASRVPESLAGESNATHSPMQTHSQVDSLTCMVPWSICDTQRLDICRKV